VSSVIAWDVRVPENIGAIVRLAANFGCERVFFVEPAGTPHNHRRIRKTAVSAPSHVEWGFMSAAEFSETRNATRPIVAVETSRGSVDLREAQWPQECSLMVGSESYGLPDEALALCQFAINIPTCGPLKSLNVSHALAIALFEATYRGTEDEPREQKTTALS
jgi:tRNA G18 (ribose-2'-O)-methylase SpoU